MAAKTALKSSKSKANGKSAATSDSRRPKSRSKDTERRSAPKQQKTKAQNNAPGKRKKRSFTEKELNLPKFNMITPAGVQKPRGKKKGKVYVDDQTSMMAILAVINAEKEGQIESKMMKARQLEEVRENRKREAEARQEVKDQKLEKTKESIKERRKEARKSAASKQSPNALAAQVPKKRVSFAPAG